MAICSWLAATISASGAAADEAKKLLDLPDALCKKDLSYASDPKLLFETRLKVAEAIEKLGR